MQIRHAFPDNKKQLLQVEGRVLLVYSIFLATTVSFFSKGFLLGTCPYMLQLKDESCIVYAVVTVIACIPPEVAQIITQKSSRAEMLP